MSDDDHIKEMGNIYARRNMLMRNCKHYTQNVKITFFFKHSVQVYIACHCELNFRNLLLENYTLLVTRCLRIL